MTQILDKQPYVGCGRRCEDNVACQFVLDDNIVFVNSESASISLVLQGFVGHKAVYIQQPFFCQEVIFVLCNILHSLVVVVYHLLRLILGRNTPHQHLFCYPACCRCPFHHTGIDGLLHPWIGLVLHLFCLCGRVVAFEKTAELHIKVVAKTLHLVGNLKFYTVLGPNIHPSL